MEYGRLILQHDRVIFADAAAAHLCGCSLEELLSLSPGSLVARFAPEDRRRIAEALQVAARGEVCAPEKEACLMGVGEQARCVDVITSQVLYAGQPAVQMTWIDQAAQQEVETSLRQHIQRLQILHDMLTALVSAGSLKQTLETLLVNLHHLIHYDRAGLFLVDENQRFVAPNRSEADSQVLTFLEENPLVIEMRHTGSPLVVSDVQADARFAAWPDVGSVRGWLGAPLLAGDELLGFISLGSLEVNAYSQVEVETMRVFAMQVAEVLERAWVREQSQRRTEELEVLSNISFALGQAESGENTLLAIVQQIAQFFHANRGVFLAPDREESSLVVKASLDETSVGLAFPASDDPFWQAYTSGQITVLAELNEVSALRADQDWMAALPGAQSALIAPLRSGEVTFGVLCLGFAEKRRFSASNLRLYRSMAEVVSASLQRAAVLEALEKQVDIRTQHLKTLYNINAVASEPLELQAVLEDVLQMTLLSLHSPAGAIHFLDEKDDQLCLTAQFGIPPIHLLNVEALSLKDVFWENLLLSTNPLVVPDLRAEADVPPVVTALAEAGLPAYIGAPIRSKGRVVGLFSLFGTSIVDYTLEEITLLMTIADQVGSLAERARLTRQAELAAVVQERQRLARELHDSVTQLLYSQVLFSGAGLKVLHQGNLPLAEQHLARIEQAAQQALREMRLMIYELRPSDHLDEGLVGALQRRLDAVEKRTGINARLEVWGKLNLDESREMALYRIAEEALNNTLKHAQAANVSIDLRSEANRVTMKILDDGCGFDLEARQGSGGMGLLNMRERTAALGGLIDIITAPKQGTQVVVQIDSEVKSGRDESVR
jgi:signal transduction histidine kinase